MVSSGSDDRLLALDQLDDRMQQPVWRASRYQRFATPHDQPAQMIARIAILHKVTTVSHLTFTDSLSLCNQEVEMKELAGHEGSGPTPAGAPPKGEVSARGAFSRRQRIVYPRVSGHRRRHGGRAIRRVEDEPLSAYLKPKTLDRCLCGRTGSLFWARWDQIEEQHADDPRAFWRRCSLESRSGSDAPPIAAVRSSIWRRSFRQETIPAGSSPGQQGGTAGKARDYCCQAWRG